MRNLLKFFINRNKLLINNIKLCRNLYITSINMSSENKANNIFTASDGTTFPSKSAMKKYEKQKAKEARKAANAEKNPQNVAKTFILGSFDDGQFGDMEVIQSRFKTGRKLVEISEINEPRNESLWLRARVHSVRAAGKGCFLVLRRSGYSIQALLFADDKIPKDMVKYVSKLTPESIVDVYGLVTKVADEAGKTGCTQSNVELNVQRIYCISKAETPLPMQMDDAMRSQSEAESKELATVGQDTRLDNRWIDLRTPANNAIFKIQSRVCQFYREYFLDLDFVEVHTPKITPGVSEGGAEVFRLKYFNDDACLAQSPQLYKQMASACSDLYRVFEIGPVFRAENSFTHRHMCEFTGLDFEMEVVEHYHEVLKVLGNLFVHIFDRLNEKCQKEMELVGSQFPFEPLKYPKDTLVIDFRDAVKMLREAGCERGDYDDFTTPEEKLLGKLVREKYDTDFYIVDRYPLSARPFYTMPCHDDPNYTNSYDVFLRGEEITSGAQRIHDVPLLKKRAQECEIPLDNIKAYLEAFKFGAPPHGGAGIGLERVVMLFLNLNNIRKSSMFPRDPHRLSP